MRIRKLFNIKHKHPRQVATQVKTCLRRTPRFVHPQRTLQSRISCTFLDRQSRKLNGLAIVPGMQQHETLHPAAAPKQENGVVSSAGTVMSNVGTSNTSQKAAHRRSRRHAKHKQGKAENGASTTTSYALANQALRAQQVVQKNRSRTARQPAPRKSPESGVQPKKSKPRPSKSARARIRAAKASGVQEPHTPSIEIAESAPDTKEPLLKTAPVAVLSSDGPSTKKVDSGAVPPQSASVQASSSTPKPPHKQLPQAKSSKALKSKIAWVFKEITGAPMRTIDTTSLEMDSTQVSSAQGFETLCSYNWQDDGAIYVPGGPPKWTPPALPFTLAEDRGRHFLDQNTSRAPKYPFEPAFRALSMMNPNTNLDKADIIVNRNSLRKLLDLFGDGRKPNPFCMGLHTINNTLVINRKERRFEIVTHGTLDSGYGHNFESSFTTPDCEIADSSSHHRVIRYHIGPLDCVVRFEVDAYYDDADTDEAIPTPASENRQNQTVDPTDDLTSAISHLKVADGAPIPASHHHGRGRPPRPSASDKPTVALAKGSLIAPTRLAEIKASKGLTRLLAAMPQLWFGRTPYFIVGKHDMGTVHTIDITHAAADFAQWEEANQERLRRMVNLLAQIKRVVQKTKGGAAVLVYDVKGGPLRIFRMKTNVGVLPRDVIAKHWTV